LHDDIQRLIKLQQIALEIRQAVELRKKGPAEIERLEEAFEADVEEIGSARLRFEDLTTRVQELRTEREQLKSRLEHGQQKLMQVSNQREYSAVLNEIDSDKQRLGTVEEEIGKCESEMSELEGPAAEADGRIQEARKTVDEKKDNILRELAGVDERIAALRREQEAIEEALPATEVRRFHTIAKARGGLVMARIADGACSACRMRIRPQVINLVKRGDEILACESCRRLLYIDDGAPEEGSTGDGGPDASNADGGSESSAVGGNGSATAAK
jgi:hypothetical protein